MKWRPNMTGDERRRYHQQVVDFILRGCEPTVISAHIANHPDLAQLDDQLDEYYILPTEPTRRRRYA